MTDRPYRTKSITIRVIPPNPYPARSYRFRAHPGHAYEESHIQDLVSMVQSRADAQFSKWKFRTVMVAKDHYNLVYDGDKPPNLLHAGKSAAKILEEINNGRTTSKETPAVPIAQESPGVEDNHDSARKQ